MAEIARIGGNPGAVRAVASAADIEIVADLAREIWYEHYVPIIGRDQVDYMVGQFQSAQAIAAQIAEGYEYCLLRAAGRDMAYGAIRPEPERSSLFLSKLYVLKSRRGAGAAHILLDEFETRGRQCGLESIWLTVNKYNPALNVYLRLGFKVTGSVVTDIGQGFVMDDYRMEKAIV